MLAEKNAENNLIDERPPLMRFRVFSAGRVGLKTIMVRSFPGGSSFAIWLSRAFLWRRLMRFGRMSECEFSVLPERCRG